VAYGESNEINAKIEMLANEIEELANCVEQLKNLLLGRQNEYPEIPKIQRPILYQGGIGTATQPKGCKLNKTFEANNQGPKGNFSVFLRFNGFRRSIEAPHFRNNALVKKSPLQGAAARKGTKSNMTIHVA
jgi:hypothetical protein